MTTNLRSRRRFRCRLVSSLVLLFVIGCFGDSKKPGRSTVENPLAGQKLEIAVPAGLGFPKAWELILDEWAAQTGAEYQLTEYEPAAGDGSLAEQLRHPIGPASKTQPTLLFFPITRIAELTADELLAAIPIDQQSEKNLHWRDLFHGLRTHLASSERRPAVVPLSCPVLVCYYRSDLLDRAGLSAPTTWEEYQKLIDSLDRWAPGMTAVEPWDEQFRTTMFLARAVAYAKHRESVSLFFDYETGEPLIAGEGFVLALELAKQVVSTMPADVLTYSPASCRNEFFAGRAALAISFETGPGNPALPFESAGSRAAESQSRPDSMSVGICRLPGVRRVFNRTAGQWDVAPRGTVNHVTLTGFAGLCAGVSADSKPLESLAAWHLLAELTLTEDHLQTAFPDATKSLCRTSQFGAASAWVGSDLTADETRQYLRAVEQSLDDTRLVTELPVAGRSAFRTALTEEIGRVLTGDAEPRDALQAVANRWSEIASEMGSEKIRDSYRRSLGLRPKANAR